MIGMVTTSFAILFMLLNHLNLFVYIIHDPCVLYSHGDGLGGIASKGTARFPFPFLALIGNAIYN